MPLTSCDSRGKHCVAMREGEHSRALIWFLKQQYFWKKQVLSNAISVEPACNAEWLTSAAIKIHRMLFDCACCLHLRIEEQPHLREVKPAIQESAKGELARLGKASPS